MNIYQDFPAKRSELCTLMSNYGSDKGHPENKSRHNYTHVYSSLFEPVRNQPIRLFELGIGSNNPSIPSNMSIRGRPGASLRAWRDYFPKGNIYGADIDIFCLMTESRMKTFWCDQTKPEMIEKLWFHDPVLHDEFDILIEDGLHTYDANKCFFENSCHKLKIGGVYCIEDIETKQVPRYKDLIETWKGNYGSKFVYRLLELKPTNLAVTDNTLLLIQRIE
jgi:hypothetical protein